MVKQAWLSAITDLVTAVLLLGISVAFFVLCFKNEWVNKIQQDVTTEGLSVVIGIILFVILGFAGIAILLPLSNLVTPIFNPEYWAYTHLLDILK